METHKSMEIDTRKLVVKKVIGRGASAHVHIGVYDGRRVAVKLFDEVRGKSNATELLMLKMVFEDETYLWHTLDHPNVSRFVGAAMGIADMNFGANRGNEAAGRKPIRPCCIISDYQSGGTLKSYLMSHHEKKLPLKKVIHFSLGLARGLSYLHAKNIMHRDIKTDNILLDKNRVVKITDFGVSTFDTSNSESITDRVGTYGYMAPEVFERKPYDKKCDAYSFGVCLWEICCCEKPFECFGFDADTAVDIYKNSSLELPKNCPKYLVDLMERCMDKDPKKRPDMEKVVEILEGIQLQCINQKKSRFRFKFWS